MLRMKKFIIPILLFLTADSLHAYTPPVRNYHRDTYRAGTQTWDIAQSPGGSMFFANNDGVLAFDGEDWTLTRLNNNSSARSLFYDEEKGCLYVGGTNELGCMRFTGKGTVYTSLLDSLGIYMNEIWSIGKDGEGQLWFEDNSTRYTLTGGSLRKEDIRRYQLTGNVFCTAENSKYVANGTTNDGVFIRSKADGSRIHLNTENGLQNNSVLCLRFDRDGGLWVGMDQGIDYIMLNHPIYNLFGKNGDFGVGYAICRSGDYLYLGTNLGLYRVRSDLMGQALSDRAFERIKGIEGQVWSIKAVGEDVMACCDRGIYICRGGRVDGFIQSDGAWKLEDLQGHPDMLLASSYTHLFLLEKKNGRWTHGGLLSGFDEAGKAFIQDKDGRIWFCHHVKGLYRLTLSDDLRSVVKVEKFGSAQGFPTDRGNYPGEYHGTVLFSTEGGFYSVDKISGRAFPVDELNHRFNGTPNSIQVFETPHGNMRYYSSGAMQAIEYRSPDGVVMDSLSMRSLVNRRPVGFECISCLDENNLILNSNDGFVIVNLDRMLSSNASNPGQVFISGISTTESGQTLYTGLSKCGKSATIRIAHKQNSIVFNYIAPIFDSLLPTEYSSMLEGYDKQFGVFSPESSRQYSHIPAGRYTFIVKARNPQHGNIETVDSIELIVERPWSQSILAIIIYILSGLTLFTLLIHLFNRQANLKAARLAAAQAEKMRQAQIRKDLQAKADDLAASTMSLQRKNELLQKISGKIDDAVESAKNGDPVEVRLKRLRGISELIRENITHENDWQKFQDNFDLVYDDFLKRLGVQFPALSVNDKRICAYLRMGLSSKDIAPLLGMTVHSVEMTRYRIRQKMGLSREDNLTAFLQRY